MGKFHLQAFLVFIGLSSSMVVVDGNINKTVPGPHLGSPPPPTSYTSYLQQDITNKKHAFLAGNNVYYISSGRWGNPGNVDDETIGLGRPFFNDLRSRGTGIVEHETTGIGNDFWGWNFHKWVEVARGTVIGGSNTGGSGSNDDPVLITNHDGSFCIAAHPEQNGYGLPVSMEACDAQDPRQQWVYNPTSGLFTNEVKGWCLFAGRPDLVGQELKTWGCDESNPQMIWDYVESSNGRIKSRFGHSAQYSDGKCIKSGSLAGDTPTMDTCNETLSLQQFNLASISSEVRYENVSPDKVYWRPDRMTMEYSIGPANIPLREDKFVSANDVISTIMYSDVPIVIEFTGKSFARSDSRTVSKDATCSFDYNDNAVRVVEGGRVMAKVSESPEVIKEADLMYTGMSTVLSSSRPIESYSSFELEPGECRYTFRLPVDSVGTTLSWTMNDDYTTALNAIQEVLGDPIGHLDAKTDEMNDLLNYNVPYFRCEDDDIVQVYYYLWAIYLMLFKYVGKGQEVHHHTQTAVNNFLGLHNWDAVMQILVGSWTTDKPTWAYGNVLLWSELPLNATSSNGMVPDNMGQSWNSGLFGGFHHAAHACGALQIYEHTGDALFLEQSYSFFDNLFTAAGGVYGEDFDASICLGKMASFLGRPTSEVTKWDEHMNRYGGIDFYLTQRWDDSRSCWLDCDENSPNGIHTWEQIRAAYKTYFPREWAVAMGETWLGKGNPDGFYADGDIPLVSIAKRDWDKVLCPGTLDTMSCDRGYWSEFAVTPDTNYYMIQGMFRHDVTKIAIDATLGHWKLNNMQWGMPTAPESREADFELWGDQYSNFNAGKILLLIEGIGGFKLSIGNSTFEKAGSLPEEWSWNEWRMPVRAADSDTTTWVLLREERFCTSTQNIWTKEITVESNPLDELEINPWTEGATVLSSTVLIDGQESNIQAENAGQDRLGFTFVGDDAKGMITISIDLESSASEGVSCSTRSVTPTTRAITTTTTQLPPTTTITTETTTTATTQPPPTTTTTPTTTESNTTTTTQPPPTTTTTTTTTTEAATTTTIPPTTTATTTTTTEDATTTTTTAAPPVTTTTPSQSFHCCSWNYASCGDSAWCNQSELQCGNCGGVWMEPNPNCIPLNGECTGQSKNSNDCCDPIGTVSCNGNIWYRQCQEKK